MRLSELSVRRPVLATVISLLLVILGLLAASRLADQTSGGEPRRPSEQK